jgi:uncharacterized protein (DUF983 family)
MYDFIVLGLIPGTHIQINFQHWLHFASLLCVVLIVWKLQRLHIFRNSIITLAIALQLRRRLAMQA